MTTRQLAEMLAQYEAGLETALVLLRQLDAAARRQQSAATDRRLDQFSVESDERDRLTRSLVTVDQQLAPLRAVLNAHTPVMADLPGFARVRVLREETASLVQSILAIDGESIRALADAELARRAELAGLDQGGATLGAYRRALTTPVGSATRLNQRG